MAATLEALIEDAASICASPAPRVMLYRALSKIWNSAQVSAGAEPLDPALPPEQRLAAITPLPRQAFLLVALEEFTDDEAAQVLDADVARLRSLVDEAGREIASEIATDVLIIEDESLIALDLQELVEGLGHRVVGIASASTARSICLPCQPFPARCIDSSAACLARSGASVRTVQACIAIRSRVRS